MYKKIELLFDSKDALRKHSELYLKDGYSFYLDSLCRVVIQNDKGETLVVLGKINDQTRQKLYYTTIPVSIFVEVRDSYLKDEVKMEDPALKKTQMIEVRNKVFYCITPEFRRVYTDVIMEELLKDNCLRDHIEKGTLDKVNDYTPAALDSEFLNITLFEEDNPYLNKIMEKFNADFIIVEDVGGQLYTYKREGLKL